MRTNVVTSRILIASLGLVAALAPAVPAATGGDVPRNWPLPPADLETRFWDQDFRINEVKGAGAGVTGASKLKIEYPDGKAVKVKWKAVPPLEADGWNNSPRKEIATYVMQRFVVDPNDYMIPTVAPHCLTMEEYKAIDPKTRPSLTGTNCVLGVIAIWMEDLEAPWPFFEEELFGKDPKYARYLSDMNVVLYLVEHRDGRRGNLLRSTDPSDPRVFAVDNGIAFDTFPWNMLVPNWNEIRVPWLARDTVERLRRIDRAELRTALGVVAEMEVDTNGMLHLVPPTTNLAPRDGVRRTNRRVQFGLTVDEIEDVEERLDELLEDVDAGKIRIR
jgi:hypothetical protein